MINEENKHDYMRSYVYNELKDNERAIFEVKLVSDAEFAKEFNIFTLLIAAYHEKRKVKFKEWSGELLLNSKPQQKTVLGQIPQASTQMKHLPQSRQWYYIAASFFVFLGVLLLWQFYQPTHTVENLLAKHLATPYEMPSGRMDIKSSQKEAIWKKAKEAYNTMQYNKAIVYLENLTQLDSSNAHPYFYIALCYLHLDSSESERAITTLQKSAQLNENYQDMSDWYISLIYLQKGEKVKALKSLRKLINNSSNKERIYKYQEAKELLEILEE